MASTKTPGSVVYEEIPASEVHARKGIHWHIPAMMTGAIVAGGLFAIGHHLFYQSLAGQPVSDGTFLYSAVSKQQVNIAIGTALAFLVKACLVFAIGVAFIQLFWSASHTFNAARTPTLSRLDSTYGAQHNLWTVLNPALWWRHPLLLAVAAIAWLVPIASIITPGTLFVCSAAVVPPRSFMVNVPNLDFRSMNFVTLMPEKKSCYTYAGPNPAVNRVTNAVMALGEILPFKPPNANASWQLEYSGPSLKCDHVIGEAFKAIHNNIHRSEEVGDNYYASWFPTKNGNQSNLLPYNLSDFKGTGFAKGSLVPSNNVDLAFYLAAIPVIGVPISPNMTDHEILHANFEIPNMTLIKCQLVNSTYMTSFSFTNGNPNITSRVMDIGEAHAVQSIQSSCTNRNVSIWMQGSTVDHCPPSNRTCIFHPGFFETLSYQAIVDAFSDQISGQIAGVASGDAVADVNSVVSSNILNTVLAETFDLIKLVPGEVRTLGSAWNESLQGLVSTKFGGLTNKAGGGTAPDLPTVVEQLFQNVTVSLMTSAALQPNYSSPTAPDPVNVTSHQYHNIYAYSAWKLWTPYCIAIALTLAAAFIGLCTMLNTNATYKDSFSTVFRASRGAKLSGIVQHENLDARYPLPHYLKSTRVWLPGFGRTVKSSPFARHHGFTSVEVPLDDGFPSKRRPWIQRLLGP